MNLWRLLPEFKGKYRLAMISNQFFLQSGWLGAYQVSRMRNGSSFLVDLRSFTERYTYYSGLYDERDVRLLAGLMKNGEIFVDIGSNIGFYGVQVAHIQRQLKKKCLVHSYEPLPSNCVRQRANYQINKLEELCFLHEYGLSDRNSTAGITLREDFASGSSTGNAAIATSSTFDSGFPVIDIPLQTFDGVWSRSGEEGAIGVVKIDVEGHEDYVLRGAQNTFAEHRPIIYSEVNKPYYHSRGIVDLDALWRGSMPDEYSILRFLPSGRLQVIELFDECPVISNVFVCPNEKIEYLRATSSKLKN